MSTERQIQASRANGAKSRGPVTPEGKINSSFNAITHGILADTVVLKGEVRDRFAGLHARLLKEFQPQTPFEASLIENMAVGRWRQMRIWGMETAGMEHEIRKRAELSFSPEDAATRTALAFRSLGDESRSLDLIHRYETRYERQYMRAHRRFQEMKDRRTPPSAPPRPELAPVESPLPDPEPLPKNDSPPPEVISKRTRQLTANKTGAARPVNELRP